MKIITLIEDSSCREDLCAEHGLSFYVETEKHRLLSDTGQSPLTWKNAQKLGLDLSAVDTVIISHGHYDHSGGLMSFAEQNPRAEIYIQASARGSYYNGRKYIGMDAGIADLPKVHWLEGDLRIDDQLSLFSGIAGRRLWPSGNRLLTEEKEGQQIQDPFVHEQCLVIEEAGKQVLLSGCAHNGILNILERYHEIYHGEPDAVISGFHMMKQSPHSGEEICAIRETAGELSKMHTAFYSGHCTGQEALDLMKEIMGEQLQQIHAGDTIEI